MYPCQTETVILSRAFVPLCLRSWISCFRRYKQDGPRSFGPPPFICQVPNADGVLERKLNDASPRRESPESIDKRSRSDEVAISFTA